KEIPNTPFEEKMLKGTSNTSREAKKKLRRGVQTGRVKSFPFPNMPSAPSQLRRCTKVQPGRKNPQSDDKDYNPSFTLFCLGFLVFLTACGSGALSSSPPLPLFAPPRCEFSDGSGISGTLAMISARKSNCSSCSTASF